MTPETIDNILVVKAGTNVLVNKSPAGTEYLENQSFNRIGAEISHLQDGGQKVVLGTSASIAAGMIETGLRERPNRRTEMLELQRLSAIGWRPLLNRWAEALNGQAIGGILLTRQELNTKAPERIELLATIQRMLERGDLPVINENDPITHEEIEFGDNDILVATLASRLGGSSLGGADVRLILLTDKAGVCEDPGDPATLMPVIKDLADFERVAGPSASDGGTGGMLSKFAAAVIAKKAGIDMWVTDGRAENTIQRTLDGEIGTYIPAK